MEADSGLEVRTCDGLKPPLEQNRRKGKTVKPIKRLGPQVRNKEQDGVGDRDQEPAQKSRAKAPGVSRKKGVRALHQPLCGPGTALEKTKGTHLGNEGPRKGPCPLLDPSELLFGQSHHCGLDSFITLMPNFFFFWPKPEFLDSVIKPPSVDSPLKNRIFHVQRTGCKIDR